MCNPPRRQRRWASAVGSSLALFATLQLPNTTGTPVIEPQPIDNPQYDFLHRLDRQDKPRTPKTYFGETDAWVAKYQVGPGGVRKVLWKRQLGTSSFDASYGVATDSNGNVLITGSTYGALGGIHYRDGDAWVAKYSPDGTLTWTRQLQILGNEFSGSVATDSSGNVFIAGSGYFRLGYASDAWVAKYSPDGSLAWTKRLGTPYNFDYSSGVATDTNGNMFVTGGTYALIGQKPYAWVSKYSPDGALLWTKPLSTSNPDYSSGAATDTNGNVFISGSTDRPGGVPVVWVAKYGPGGFLKWKRQLDTSDIEGSSGVATDSEGNVFITGSIRSALENPSDAWVAKYSSHGTLLWNKQLGTSDQDVSSGVATDNKGNVFITGYTSGALGGTNKGGKDAWAAKLNPQGKQLWLRQDGTRKDDLADGVAVDNSGFVITTGYTDGNFSKD